MKELKGEVAVVTGAAGGIGLTVVERFLEEGMRVVLADIDPAALARETERLSGSGGDVLGVECDVRDPNAVDALAQRTLDHFGSVHIIMNNAGVAPVGPMLETSAADWRWAVDVNVMGVAHGVISFGPILRDAGAGHIINTASEAGLVTNSSLGMYCATKHAVVGLTESLYRELEATDVGVHCLCPNLVRTRIFESERNRDDAFEMSPNQTAMTGSMREALTSMGIGTDKVATDVIEAIKNDRFWILTHDFTAGTAGIRISDINENRNPSDPYAAVAEFAELRESD